MADNLEKFTSVTELYTRLLPALNAKLSEFKRLKITDLTPVNLWNYCLDKKWVNKKDLGIHDLVDDILNIDILEIKEYLKNKN